MIHLNGFHSSVDSLKSLKQVLGTIRFKGMTIHFHDQDQKNAPKSDDVSNV